MLKRVILLTFIAFITRLITSLFSTSFRKYHVKVPIKEDVNMPVYVINQFFKDFSHHRVACIAQKFQSMRGDDNLGSSKDDDNEFETKLEVDEEGIVYKKSRKIGIPFSRAKSDDRDNLPYKTYVLLDGNARNAEHIATLRLGALTACGDILDLGERGLFKVIRVSFLYKWNVTGFQITGKRLYCQRAIRQWALPKDSFQ